MKKNSLASIELAAIINELQFLKKGKLSQIYHQDQELLLQLHAPGHGKQLLKIVPGKLLCLTADKYPPARPSGFCQQLRKYLDQAFIKDIYQQDAERIVVFQLEKPETYYLIIELFSKGNVILADAQWMAIGVLEQQLWKDRSVKAKHSYTFPSPGINWKIISLPDFEKILKKSDKKNIATTLATEINLGGAYAEEICIRANVDKNKTALVLDSKQIKMLYSELKEVQQQIKQPRGYVYDEQIIPFPLIGLKPLKITETYNEAVNLLKPFQQTSPFDKKIANLQRIAAEQQEAINVLKEKIVINKKKGELLYERYASLQKLIEIVAVLKKTKTWTEIASELRQEKRIKAVNLKTKTIVIDL
ncbi:MAG TPA: NFACT family protein [Candidatus Nanoarchaeia archaeon]|nr:NFACT family protein [Candidatus Nanoarchaeia archaeon]